MDRMAHAILAAGVTTVFHPVAYAKTLIQVGYEPLAAIESRGLFGGKVLMYPNVFQYIGHIKRTDGFLGLYRGLTPRLVSNIVGNLVSNAVSAELSGRPVSAELAENEEGKVDPVVPAGVKKLLIDTTFESMARCAGVVASQPFHVIVIRCMCQFVGKETKYNTLSSSISEIWHNEGILGFFAGLVPRVLGELITIWLANIVSHIVNNFLFTSPSGSKDVRSYSSTFSQLVVSQMTYPFIVVSTVMAVNDSSLLASSLCRGPLYSSWTDCWSRLSKQDQLKRGSGLVRRAYKGPNRIGMDGRLQPAMEPLF